MPPTWDVIPYSPDNLRSLLAKRSGLTPSVIGRKLHCTYFDQYFKDLKAETILVEEEYVDRDFLEDFAAYYARCFQDYQRKCIRLHFFTFPFTPDQFAKHLGDPADRSLESLLTGDGAYLGFVVVRPLPGPVVGRTCLKTYPQANRRFFPVTRTYEAHIFGLTLKVETLAFQEQDRQAAACATSAIWSAFQATGKLFQHHIPSPVEITKGAMEHTHFNLRPFPQEGLTVDQMGNAVHAVGLEPSLVNAKDNYVLKATAYAYVQGGVPILLVGDLFDTSTATPADREEEMHAVVITGYSLADGSSPEPQGAANFLLRASRIDKLYCHDDQVGPFARMEFDGIDPQPSLSTSWIGENGQMGAKRFMPHFLVVPLYHKIRIAYDVVEHEVVHFDSLLKWIAGRMPNGGKDFPMPEEWDISLTFISKMKEEFFEDASLGGARKTLLEQPMPRYLWRATGLHAGTRVIELLFDATDIQQNTKCVAAIERNAVLWSLLKGLVAHPASRAVMGENSKYWNITQKFE
jgi:hypothetical protein